MGFCSLILKKVGVQITADMSLLKRCMLYWYHWNLLCERIAGWQYRIEDIDNVFAQFCVHIRRGKLCQEKDAILDPTVRVMQNVNSYKSRYDPRSWLDLMDTDPELTKRIQVLAWSYGYRC